MLRADVDDSRIGRRHHDRERPLEALRDVGRRVPHRVVGVRVDRTLLTRVAIEPRDQAAVAARIEDVRVARIARDVAALAAAHRVEHLIGASARSPRAALRGLARHAGRAVVLLGAADVIRHVLRRDDVIELRRRHRLSRPGLAAVHRDRGAAVVAFDHPVRIVRRDPQVVVVAVGHVHRLPRLARIGRPVDVDVQHPHGVLHLGIGVHPRVVERALAEIAPLADPLPRRTGVVGQKEPALVCLDLRVNAIRVGARHGQADLPERAFRQPGVPRDLGPVVSAVGRLEDPAAGSTARHFERVSIRLPQRDVHHLRVVRIDDQLVGAGLVVPEQDPVPRLPAILRSVDAALRIRRRVMAERRHVHEVRVRRIDPDLGDDLRLGEADVRPRLAAVGGLVGTAALNDVAADVRFTRADVDDVGVRGGDGDGADRRVVDQGIGHRLPRHAGIGGLPQSTARGAHVVLVRARGAAGHGDRSSATRRAQTPPAQRAERPGVGRRGRPASPLRVDDGGIDGQRDGRDQPEQHKRLRRPRHGNSPEWPEHT